ncbi:unnamed protein product [Fraxinus pennsylvanica]|uniref:Uncharacterized protein n=1 Tax=Fraxinus pennsylvanica TaxID=56036 RepID=A0AAD2AJJ1_9LAMI|nr:unnamed protein product [Fraxinus pennsylvanica]
MEQISFLLVLAYAVVALYAVAVTVSDQSPDPTPDAGDAFSLTVSSAVIGTSVLFSLFALNPMAQISIAKSLLLAYAVVAISAAAVTVSAQGPAPSPDAGDALSLPVSGAIIGTSLLFSLFAILRH